MQTVAAYSEVVTYWRGLIGTLVQRGLLRQRQDGRKVIPEAVAIVEPQRVTFVLDMLRLGGVSREQWLDEALWHQVRAALQGRRVFVADSGGLAVVVAREPNKPERKRLPARVVLNAEAIPDGDYTVLLGEARDGPVTVDLAEGERAILMGGTSGSGKTGTIIGMCLQLAQKNGPEQFGLAVVDLKRLDFPQLAGLPHLVHPVATEEEDAIGLIHWCEQEMARRQAVMAAASVNRWELLPEGERFPLLLVVIDEYGDLAYSGNQRGVIRIAQQGRASGISIIVATQRPDRDTVDPQIKANCPTRIAFQVVDGSNSRVVLDRTGAEKLTRTGQCLTNAGGKWRRVQTAYVPEEKLGGWLAVPGGQALSEVEQALVKLAVDELDGAFKVSALYKAFKGEMSKYAIEKLAKDWEARGWLSEPSYDDEGRKQSRRITPELATLALNTVDTRPDTVLGDQTRPDTADTETRKSVQGAGVELPPFLAARYGKVAPAG